MRVAFVTGPVPAGQCGVGDYTRMLALSLERKGIRVEIFESPGTEASRAVRLFRSAKLFQPDISHVQYPTLGFGKGFTPQLFSMLTRFVLTLHEVEGAHLLRRLSLYPLWARALHVIFTCDSNKQYAIRWAPWLAEISTVIPLSSSIPVAENGHAERRSMEVIHFGLIRPNKGLEDVLEFARLFRAEGLPIRVRIVGGLPSNQGTYFDKLQRSSVGFPVIWEPNLGEEAVAERLSKAAIAYMPFPGGVTEKNSSILAPLANGVPVITTNGKFLPPGIEDAVRFCDRPSEALVVAKELLHNPTLREALSGNARKYAAKFSWSSIAECHIKIYEQIVASMRTHA